MRIIEVMGCAFSDRDHLDVGGVLVSLRESDMFTCSERDNQAKPSRQACLSARRRRLLRERFGSAKTKHEVRKSFDFQLARSICSLAVNAIIKQSRVGKLVCQRGGDDCSASVLAQPKQSTKCENLSIFSSQGVYVHFQ